MLPIRAVSAGMVQKFPAKLLESARFPKAKYADGRHTGLAARRATAGFHAPREACRRPTHPRGGQPLPAGSGCSRFRRSPGRPLRSGGTSLPLRTQRGGAAPASGSGKTAFSGGCGVLRGAATRGAQRLGGARRLPAGPTRGRGCTAELRAPPRWRRPV